jgi:hypothetical protein
MGGGKTHRANNGMDVPVSEKAMIAHIDINSIIVILMSGMHEV